MRVFIGLMVVGLLALPAFGQPQVWSYGFATPDGNDASLVADGWVHSGLLTAGDDNNRPSPDGHDTNIQRTDGAGVPQHVSGYSIDIPVIPGDYDVTLTGWMKVYCSDWSWAPMLGQSATIELTIDGSVVASATIGGTMAEQDAWLHVGTDLPPLMYSGPIANKVDVHIITSKTVADFRVASSGRFDDLVVDIVPEPASLLLLGLPLLFLRRRR